AAPLLMSDQKAVRNIEVSVRSGIVPADIIEIGVLLPGHEPRINAAGMISIVPIKPIYIRSRLRIGARHVRGEDHAIPVRVRNRSGLFGWILVIIINVIAARARSFQITALPGVPEITDRAVHRSLADVVRLDHAGGVGGVLGKREELGIY